MKKNTIKLYLLCCTLLTILIVPAKSSEDDFSNLPALKSNIELITDHTSGELKGLADLWIRKEMSKEGMIRIILNPDLIIDRLYNKETGEVIEPEIEEGMYLVNLSEELEKGEVILSIKYHGKSKNPSFLYIGPESAYGSWLTFWYPTLDAPLSGHYGKNIFRVKQGLTVASNGTLVSSEIENDCSVFEYSVEEPLFPCFAADTFFISSEAKDGLEVRAYLTERKPEKAKFYLERTLGALLYLRDLFGFYPYENLSLVELGDMGGVRAGGFCEQGLIFLPSFSMPDNYFNFPVIIHEVGHLWWGNWVIGDETVMSEGLAQLSMLLTVEKELGSEIMYKYIKHASLDHFIGYRLYLSRFSDGGIQEPKLGDDLMGMDQHYVNTTKGPLVFLLLREQLGSEVFFRGLQRIAREHVREQLPVRELFRVWEEESGENLSLFYDQWIMQAGVPVLNTSYKIFRKDDGYEILLNISQLEEQYFFPLEIEVKGTDSRRKFKLNVEGEKTQYAIRTDFEPQSIVLDPQMKLPCRWAGSSEDVRFAKIWDWSTSRADTIEILKRILAEKPGDAVSRIMLVYWMKGDAEADSKIEQLEYIRKNIDPHGEYEIWYSKALSMLIGYYQEQGNDEEAAEVKAELLSVDRTGRFTSMYQ